jgi:hypothetical protein
MATSIDGSGKGYIRLHRKLLENPIFTNKPVEWFKIWIFILLRVNWRESTFHPRQGESIIVPAGSMVTSLEKLGTYAGLSKEHARRCLDYFVRTHTITLETTHHWTKITVVNWAAYQQSEDDAHHGNHHSEHHAESEIATHHPPQATPHAATLSKEVKNLNKKYTSNSGELDTPAVNHFLKAEAPTSRKSLGIAPTIRDWFEGEFWPIYPRHEGKQSALKAANAKATTPEKRAFYLASLQSQLPAYGQRKQEAGQRVIPMAATWFNQDRADDELDLPRPSEGRAPRAAAQDDYPEYLPLSSRTM